MLRFSANFVSLLLLIVAGAIGLAAQTTPQVVTVVQRLSGLQALSMLREAGDGAIAQVDNAELLQSCHWVTNVTAGLALADGKSVLVYLAHNPDDTIQNPTCPANEALQVYTAGGQPVATKFIGFDARTGLSLLQASGSVAPALRAPAQSVPQQSILVFAPQQNPAAYATVAERVNLQMGAMETRLQEVTQTTDGQTVQLLLSGLGLTPALIGGVAVSKNDAEETLGLVTYVRPNQARVLPLASALQAAARIRARGANVPRPWLGIAAQEISALPAAEWARFFRELAQPTQGVILTKVLAQTPAASAGLRAGDILLTLNGQPLANTRDFSYFLAQRDGGETITFTARRKDAGETLTFAVKLGETNDALNAPARASTPDSLTAWGLESLGLAPAVAKTLRSRGGRVVLSVQRGSAAARAGLQPGDVIEFINRRQLSPKLPALPLKGKFTLSILRQGKRFNREITPL